MKSLPLSYKDLILLLIGAFFLTGMISAHSTSTNLLDEVHSGSLLLQSQGDDGRLEQIPGTQLRSDVRMRIRGMVAEVDVVQTFRNDSSNWVEGTYAFPLPDEAAVNRMVMQIGARRIEGEIQEKQTARRTYEAARDAGQQASLVTQQRPNLFTSKVANIGPGEELSVTIGYVQALSYRDGQFSVRFPLTLTPRFGQQPAELLDEALTPVGTQDLDSAVDASRGEGIETTPLPVSMTIELEPGFELVRLESRYHDIMIGELTDASGQPRFQIDLSDGQVAANRDFELVWEPALRDAPQSAVLTERFGGEDYALMMVLPPQPEHLRQQARELILVVDTSGSMHGASLEQAKDSLRMALGALLPEDRFNIIQFNSVAERLFKQPVAATDEAVGAADQYIQRLQANGGTNIAAALQQALVTSSEPGLIRQVVFVTDGAVGNEPALFKQIENNLGDARLFTVGIGAAPNNYFMHKAAEFGRGSYSLVSDLTEVAEKMDQLLSKLEHPALTELETSWPGAAETYPAVIPDLYLNEPLIVVAKLDALNGAMALRGWQGDQVWHDQLDVVDAEPGSGIATLWARRKVGSLMDDLAMGADPAVTRGHVLETALQFALVTRFTSFVAVDKTPARSATAALRQDRVKNLRPQAMSLPQTATASMLHLVFGSLVLLLAAAFAARLRDER